MKRLAPSILSADFSCLSEQVEKVEKGGAHFIHIDVMDGHFVPNISYGAVVMKSLLGKTGLPFDVHLMIEHPERYIDDFVTEYTEYITVHQEACPHLHKTIHQIKSAGIKAGVSINPATPVAALSEILGQVDLVLLMSVNPGFGGQLFIEGTLSKIKELEILRNKKNLDFVIEVDGGIDETNVNNVVDQGADIVVMGSSIYKEKKIEERTKEIIALIHNKEK